MVLEQYLKLVASIPCIFFSSQHIGLANAVTEVSLLRSTSTPLTIYFNLLKSSSRGATHRQQLSYTADWWLPLTIFGLGHRYTQAGERGMRNEKTTWPALCLCQCDRTNNKFIQHSLVRLNVPCIQFNYEVAKSNFTKGPSEKGTVY